MKSSAIVAVLFALHAGSGNAQTAAAPSPEDLLALSFYYQQQDEASARSELQRLQTIYPEWQPPEDLAQLSQSGPSAEIDTIYRQIGAGQFDEARATIAAAEAAFADWTPPDEMILLLDTSEGQVLLDDALAAGDLARALTLAGARPGLLRCDRINNAWRIADAQQAAGGSTDALGTYRAILGACVVPTDIITTLEKSSAVASAEQMQGLFAQASARFPEMTSDLATVQARLTGQPVAAAPPTADPAPALTSTGTSSSSSPTAVAPATQLAAPQSAPPPEAVPQTAPQDAPVAATTSTPRASSGAGAYQRAWEAYNLDRPMEAIAQFQAASQGRLDATQRRDAQYGIALSYLKMGMSDNAARIAAATDLSRQQRVDVERQILDQRGVAAYNRRDYRRAVEFFDALQGLTGSLRRDLDVLRAYAYLNSGQHDRARQEFTRLHSQLATPETRRGLSALQ